MKLFNIFLLFFEGINSFESIWIPLSSLKSINLIQSGKDSQAIAAIKGSKEWPENLGIGKPYDPDERLQNILLDYIKDKTRKNEYIESLKNLEKEKMRRGYQSILIDAALAFIK